VLTAFAKAIDTALDLRPHNPKTATFHTSPARQIDPDGLKAAVTELETGPYTEDPWSKLVEVITLD